MRVTALPEEHCLGHILLHTVVGLCRCTGYQKIVDATEAVASHA